MRTWDTLMLCRCISQILFRTSNGGPMKTAPVLGESFPKGHVFTLVTEEELASPFVLLITGLINAGLKPS